jgi:hypothetical protein
MFLARIVRIIHDHPLYLICPDLLIAVGETFYRIWAGSSYPHIVFTICLCIYLYFRCKVYSYPIVHMKIILTTENCHHFPPEITPLFLLTTLYTTSLIPLAYSTTSVSHPSPLSAANRFSHLNFSVGNPSYVSPMVS